MVCVLDTNPLIYFIARSAQLDVIERIESAIRAGARFSVVTRIEILSWREHTADSRLKAAALLNQLVEIPLSQSIVDRTIELRSMVSIKLPDAIIAASALVENLPLMTRNTGDFTRIPGLVLIDPFGA